MSLDFQFQLLHDQDNSTLSFRRRLGSRVPTERPLTHSGHSLLCENPGMAAHCSWNKTYILATSQGPCVNLDFAFSLISSTPDFLSVTAGPSHPFPPSWLFFCSSDTSRTYDPFCLEWTVSPGILTRLGSFHSLFLPPFP